MLVLIVLHIVFPDNIIAVLHIMLSIFSLIQPMAVRLKHKETDTLEYISVSFQLFFLNTLF